MEETATARKVRDYRFLVTIAICVGAFFLCNISIFLKNFNVRFDDLHFHYNRIVGIADALRSGRFPVKYYDNFLAGGGYLSPIFYGDVFLFLPALLVLCGISPIASFFIFNYLIALAMAISMYFLLKSFTKNKYLCVIGATFFVLSAYIFTNLFRRAAVGESIGIVFMIWLFYGIRNMLYQDFSKPWILSIAFLGMLLSHMTTLIISVVILIVVILFNAKKLLTKKSFYLKALFAFSVFIAIGFYYICSFLEMYFSDKFFITIPWTYTSTNQQTLLEVFITSPYGLGAAALVPIILRLFLFKKKDMAEEDKSLLKTIDKFMIIAYVLALCTTKIFPWKWVDNLFAFLQFPYRLLSISSILLAIVFTLELYLFKRYGGAQNFTKLLLTCVLSFAYIFIFNNLFLIQVRNNMDNMNNDMTAFEWYPAAIKNTAHETGENSPMMIDPLLNVLDDQDNMVDFTRKPYDTEVTFISTENSTFYIVPIVFYKGYEAIITFDDGTHQSLEVYENEFGYVGVKTEKKAGTIVVRYAGTTVQSVSFVISVIATNAAAIFAIVYVIIKKKKLKKLQENSQKI